MKRALDILLGILTLFGIILAVVGLVVIVSGGQGGWQMAFVGVALVTSGMVVERKTVLDEDYQSPPVANSLLGGAMIIGGFFVFFVGGIFFIVGPALILGGYIFYKWGAKKTAKEKPADESGENQPPGDEPSGQ